MHENSQNFYNNIQAVKDSFINFPTIIVPEEFQNEETITDISLKNPLRKNYEYVCNIGRYWKETGLDIKNIKEIIKKVQGTSVDQENRIKALNLYEEKIGPDFNRLSFGAVQSVPFLNTIFKEKINISKTSKNKVDPIEFGLPSDIEYRINRLNSLLYKVPFEKSLYELLLEK
jgi:hypothetical protein